MFTELKSGYSQIKKKNTEKINDNMVSNFRLKVKYDVLLARLKNVFKDHVESLDAKGVIAEQ